MSYSGRLVLFASMNTRTLAIKVARGEDLHIKARAGICDGVNLILLEPLRASRSTPR
jgi:hypothetical protein